MINGPMHAESSSARQLLGTGRPLCVICGVRPAFNNGRKAYPTCGLTCASHLNALMQIADDAPKSDPLTQHTNKPLCVMCGVRPQFNNGRRAYVTCGNTCARILQDIMVTPSSVIGSMSSRPSTKMCQVCNLKPRSEIAGKVYPTCGLECAARLHQRDRQVAIEPPRIVIHPAALAPNIDMYDNQDLMQTSSSRGVTPSSSDVFQKSFECIICLETLEGHNLADFACEHTFCRECLKNHITSEIDQHHYPIICPSCKVGKRRSDQPISTVDLDMMQNLGLGEAELAVFFELQMSAHSIPIHCRKCEETMFVDRTDYQQTKIIECPLPLCNYSWCKDCSQEVVHGGPRHSCDGSKELEMLIKENGWRLCPGCEIPVQKTAGCNHMTCSAPGCNTHFCYQCGKFIIQSLISGDIRKAYKKHYRKCRLF